MPRHTSSKPAPASAEGRTQPGRVMQPGEQHPDEWRGDLNPNRLAGQNVGPAASQHEKQARTAHDVKPLHRRLSGFSDDVLRQIPVLPPGARLQQGATYVDLNDPEAHEFVVTGDMAAGSNHYYVPKDEVDYQAWNRLIGVDDPERVGSRQ